jgi:hypothetical protein
MAIILRSDTATNTGKGEKLTFADMDANFESLYFSSSIDGNTITLFTTGSVSHSIDLTAALTTSTGLFLVTSSYNGQVLTFEKGDGSTYTLDLNEVVTEIESGSLIASASYASEIITFTKGDGTTFDIDISGLVTEIESGSLLKSSSYSAGILTFEKGDGTTYDLNIDSISGSAVVTGSYSAEIITFEKGDGSTFTLDLSEFVTETESGSLLKSSSFASGVMTFEKGDGTTYDLNLNSISGSGLASASLANQIITFTKGDGTTFDVDLNEFVTQTESGSLLLSGSYDSNTNVLTFTKGDGTTFGVDITSAADAKITVTDTSTNQNFYLTFVSGSSGEQDLRVDSSAIIYNPSTNTLQTENLVLTGDLVVTGTRTELQVSELRIEDKLITVASGSTSSATADGAGIEIAGADQSITWDSANSRFKTSTSLHVSGGLSIGSTTADEGLSTFLVLDGSGNVKTRSTGAQGAQGAEGAQGLQGAQGPTGAQGAEGAQGSTGAQGNQGAQGAIGSQGAEGAQGLQGAQGAEGAQGLQGLQGAQGAAGNNGAQGAGGAQGSPGNNGTNGAQGAIGSQGAEGAQGLQGAQGSPGNNGAQGAEGAQGAAGNNGNNGTDGAQGAQGAAGNNGAQGSPGNDGNNGAQGAQGSPGNNGNNGAQGAQGAPGNNGNNGAQGAQGAPGNDGNNGAQGAQGAPGNDGNNGADGAQGAQGAPGNNGNNGAQGAQGAPGNDGNNGAQGAQGPTGAQGTDGSLAVTLYNSDSSLEGNRVVNHDNYSLTFKTGNAEVWEIDGSGVDVNVYMKFLPEPEEPFTSIIGYDRSTGQLYQQDVASSGAQGAQGAQGTTGAQGSPGSGGGITITSPLNNRVLSCIDNAGSSALAEADLTFTPSSGFGTQNWLDINAGGLSINGGGVYMGTISATPSYLSTTTILTIPRDSYAAIFIDYVLSDNTTYAKMRTGTMIAHWNSSVASYTNYNTVDIGGPISGTSNIVDAIISGGNVLVRILSPSLSVSGHFFRATYRLLPKTAGV